ncbi:hypothetical protein F5Y18DRAFT_147881 [Xylariaceae sp. FL1019]|nr:hypothetical protein F5Y18DRAFT_147881 [Xylariaceae sp. FL1019]
MPTDASAESLGAKAFSSCCPTSSLPRSSPPTSSRGRQSFTERAKRCFPSIDIISRHTYQMSSSGHDDEPSPGRLGSSVGAASSNARTTKKKRVRNFTADDRAAHRIFEKSRREAFKEALTNLAALLPALSDTDPQRLSKHVVVDESISFISSQRDQIRSATENLEAMTTERDQLLAELNQWRSGAGMALRHSNAINQLARHDGEVQTRADVVSTDVPPVLQPTGPSLSVANKRPEAFAANTLRGPGMPPLRRNTTGADLSWNSFGNSSLGGVAYGLSPIQPAGESEPSNMPAPNPVSIPTYQDSRPDHQAQFEVNVTQQDPMYMSYEPDHGEFQQPGFMQAPVPLQNYMPP